jgi:dolichol kinase
LPVPATLHDPALVLASLAAVLILVFLTRSVARALHASSMRQRKALHALIGAWTLVVTPRFHHLGWAVVPPVIFGAVNASAWGRTLMPDMARTAREARGLWTFPLAVVLIYILFWSAPPRAPILAGIAVLALADPIASLVGARWGQRKLLLGGGRTLEGSLAFLIVAAVVVGMVAVVTGGYGAVPWRMGIGCGAIGAIVEAWTPAGWDNLTVPIAIAGTYHLLA